MAGVKEHSLGNYTLVFDFKALYSAEEELGPLPALMMDPLKAASVRTTAVLLKSGLDRKHGLSLEETFSVIDEVGLNEASSAVRDALQKAYPETTGETDPKPKAG